MKRSLLKYTGMLLALWIAHSCSKPEADETPKPESDPGPNPSTLQFPPKEMRAVWVATAWELDWPMGEHNQTVQKQKYIQYLDKFRELGINAVFFQIRAMGDAYYASQYEPWAASITGVRGQDPGYDVLRFLIDEAHARGIAFHAWMNPYRISTRTGSSSPYPALHPSIDPSWVLSHEKIRIYNPARPEVRQRIVDIVKELLVKYDVDGLHLDDYFYPDPSSAGAMVSDQADYQTYGAGFASIQAWRRANVDKAIEAIHQAIVSTKPAVQFSISPAANKDYNYNTLYADLAKWSQQGWLDLLVPQLYQEIGNSSNNFQTNMGIWTQYAYSVPVVIGHGFYKFGDPTAPAAFQSATELERQLNMAKAQPKVVGSAMYSARFVMDNKIGITDKLRQLYADPAVMPFLGRAALPVPSPPRQCADRRQSAEMECFRKRPFGGLLFSTGFCGCVRPERESAGRHRRKCHRLRPARRVRRVGDQYGKPRVWPFWSCREEIA